MTGQDSIARAERDLEGGGESTARSEREDFDEVQVLSWLFKAGNKIKNTLTPRPNKDGGQHVLGQGIFKIHYCPQPKSTERGSHPTTNPIKIDIVAIGNGDPDDWYFLETNGNNTGRPGKERSSLEVKEDQHTLNEVTEIAVPAETEEDSTEKDTFEIRSSPSDPTDTEKKVGQPAPPAEPTGVNWLAYPTMLPCSMRQARIMEYRYRKGNGAENIEEAAKIFLQCLLEQRDNCRDRPVIFIAHGYGGWVLEKALELDSTRSSSTSVPQQLIRLRSNTEGNPNTDTTSSLPDVLLSSPPGSERHNAAWTNNGQRRGPFLDIPPPRTLHPLSVVAGAIFLETSMEDPYKDSKFHYNFLSLIVEWDIPVRWYSKGGLSKPLFQKCSEKYDAPRSRLFSEGGNEGSLNKFPDLGDQNYSSVRRDIRTIFRDDLFLEAVFQDNSEQLSEMLNRLDPSEPKLYGNMALHIASRLGHEEVLKTLLEHDVDLTAKTQKPDPNAGQTALRIAVEKRKLKIVQLLLQRGNPTDPSDPEMSQIMKSAEKIKEEKDISKEDKDTSVEIQNLLTTAHLIEGPSVDCHLALEKFKDLKLEDADLTPNAYGTQASKKYRITVKDFFVGMQESQAEEPDQAKNAKFHYTEYRNITSYSVYDVLYKRALEDQEKSVQNLKESKDLGKLIKHFTWYHVPTNNLAWVQGLLVKLRLQKWFHQGAVENKGQTPHSRFFLPKTTVFKRDTQTKIPITLFTPFLSIELLENQREMAKSISRARVIHPQIEAIQEDETYARSESHFNSEAMNKDALSGATSSRNDLLLILGYAAEEKGLHIRRTLAQSYYPMLPHTKIRDKNQVLASYTDQDRPKCVAMVDQLWLYILDDKLITSFPLRWGEVHGTSKGPDMLDLLLKSLRKGKREPILSIFDLASVIIKRCTGLVAGEHERLPLEHDLLGTFSKAIGKVANEEAKFFKKFNEYFMRLHSLKKEVRAMGQSTHLRKRMYDSSDSEISGSEDSDSDSESNEEFYSTSRSSLFRTELRKMQKREFIRDFEIELSKKFNDITRETAQLIAIKDIEEEIEELITILKAQIEVIEKFEAAIPPAMKGTAHTQALAELLEGCRMKLSKLNDMAEKSKTVETGLDHLLSLKQSQANASEAQKSNSLAEETRLQGKTLNLFTAVTIVFLPASFMTTFLTIPIIDYPHKDDGTSAISLSWAAKYIFSISFSISIPLLYIAFNFTDFEKATDKLSRKPKAFMHVLHRLLASIIYFFCVILIWLLDIVKFLYDIALSLVLLAVQCNGKRWRRRNRISTRMRWWRRRGRKEGAVKFLGLW